MTVQDRAADVSAMAVLVGGGEMGALMRDLDWATTPLGPMELWPQSLRTAVSICLASRFPMLIWWGPDLVMLYNDAYRPMLGTTKHPTALGQRGRECWPEIWDLIGPMLEHVLATGEATWSADQLLPLDRSGYVEECYFTFSYSPIRDETGGIGGVFTAVTETTAQLLGERRLRMLRELGALTAQARTVEDVCAVAMSVLATNPADVPFAVLYRLDATGTELRVAASIGPDASTLAYPRRIDLASVEELDSTWPLAQVVRTGQATLVERPTAWGDATDRTPGVPDAAAVSTMVLPVAQAAQEHPAALLVAGISPRRTLDDDYRGFFLLVAGQIATAIADARAFEEERRRAEALAELDQAKTTFFSNVSHEFRTPLTLALGPVEEVLAASGALLPVADRERLAIAHRNHLRLLKLVNTLLDFARIEAGRAEASYEPTDLALLTADLASVFRSATERAGLRLVVECSPLPEAVYVDREMWEKIVLNLLSNAVKYTFEGLITVALHAVKDTVVLEVRDTGTGIPAEEIPRLFDRFHRVRGALARTHEGTGIGLALVQELVRLHEGTVTVTSTMGEGTTVTVTLPLGARHPSSERIVSPRSAPATFQGSALYLDEVLRWLPEGDVADAVPRAVQPESETAARILLADDNADMRAYIGRLLGTRYGVEAVADGTAALESARARPPDLVLADVMMPGLDGLAFVRAVRADPRTATLPVILLSARAGEEARVEGLQAGADDYLVKPFAATELQARVQAHVALARRRQEAQVALAAERDSLRAAVAARLQAEEALRTSEARYRAIAETANEGIWMIDREARTLFANARLADLLGTTPHNVLTGTVLDFVFPVDLALARERIEQNLTGLTDQFEFRFRRADGTAVDVLACTSPVRAADGQIVGALGMFSDITARRRADASLRQQAALLTLSRDAVIVRGPDGHILTWSEGATTLYGWSAAEAIGQRTHLLLRTRVLPSGAAGEDTDVSLVTQGSWEGTLEHRRRDGTHVVVESRQALLRSADGSPEAILEINRDMAERQALGATLARLQALQSVTDAALARLEQPALLRQLLERIAVVLAADNAAILLLDRPGGDLIVYDALGPEEAQIGHVRVPIGQGVAGRIAATRQPLIVPDLRALAPVNPLLQQHMASLLGVPLLVENRVIGVIHVDSVSPRQFTDDDLSLLQLVADRVALALENMRLYRDALASRDHAEEMARQVQSERDRLQQVLDVLPEGILIADPRPPRVVAMNRAAEELIGSNVVGQLVPMPSAGRHSESGARRLDGTPYPIEDSPLERALLRGEVVRGAQILLRHAVSGREVPILANSAPLRDANGAVIGAVDVFQDITAIRDLERQREEFLAMVSHDLKNPLTSILGLCQMLQQRLNRSAEVDRTRLGDGLGDIVGAARQMAAQIDELLDLTRIRMGQPIQLERSPTDVVALVRSVVDDYQRTTERHVLRASSTEAAAVVFVDAVRLRRALANVLGNAIKYSPQGGEIRTCVTHTEDHAGEWFTIHVADHGVGIPAAEVDRVFDSFYRASNVAGHYAGTGLGLAGVRQVIAQHGGTVALESIEGEGTTITIRLPLHGPEVAGA